MKCDMMCYLKLIITTIQKYRKHDGVSYLRMFCDYNSEIDFSFET